MTAYDVFKLVARRCEALEMEVIEKRRRLEQLQCYIDGVHSPTLDEPLVGRSTSVTHLLEKKARIEEEVNDIRRIIFEIQTIINRCDISVQGYIYLVYICRYRLYDIANALQTDRNSLYRRIRSEIDKNIDIKRLLAVCERNKKLWEEIARENQRR